MLAGVTGIDFGLLVIAADDGVMPQTREHLAIFDLLEVGRGAVAITKVDRVSAERRAEVAAAAADLLRPTTLAGAPLFALSALTGEGVGELEAHLDRTARATRLAAARGGVRLAVDRSTEERGGGTECVSTGKFRWSQ